MKRDMQKFNYCFARVLLQLLENDCCPTCSFLNPSNHPDNPAMQLTCFPVHVPHALRMLYLPMRTYFPSNSLPWNDRKYISTKYLSTAFEGTDHRNVCANKTLPFYCILPAETIKAINGLKYCTFPGLPASVLAYYKTEGGNETEVEWRPGYKHASISHCTYVIEIHYYVLNNG